MRSTVTLEGNDLGSTAKPWFWEVISILPEARSLTGWLPPRWPNFNLKVFPPRAWPRIWWPRQIPKIGRPVWIRSRTDCTAYPRAAGSPGPLERKMPAGLYLTASAAEVVAGTTWTWKPCWRKRRKMLLHAVIVGHDGDVRGGQ